MSDLLQLPTQAAARFSGEVWSIHETSVPTYLGAMLRNTVNPFAIAMPEANVFDREEPGYRVYGKTAVFIADGVMVPGGISRWGECDTTSLSVAFRAAAADASVEDGLLLLNTPGGSTQGQDVLVEAQKAFTEKKQLTGQVDQLCCSAGYWLLAQCHKAYAAPRDTIGSIGVRSAVWDWSKYFGDIGVEVVSFATGPFKAMGLTGTEVTAEQRKFWQDRVDYLFADFKRDVMAGRKMSEELFAEIGDGRYWFGEQAVGLGLLDGTRRLSVALAGLHQSNPQPTSKGSRAMAEGANNENQPAAAPKVTAKELKATFEHSTAEWREEQVEKGATMAEASVAYANKMAAEAKDLKAKLDAADAEKEAAVKEAAEKGAKPQRGTDPVGGGAEGGGAVDYRAEARRIEKEYGVSRAEAQHRVIRQHGADAAAAFKLGQLPV